MAAKKTLQTSSSGQNLLSTKISDLAIAIEGSPIQRLIRDLYRELEGVGISFKPGIYLSDGWGCPDRVPVIGVPFYVADPRLSELRFEMTGIEPQGDVEAMSILRHEAGHAFNYAYRLYESPGWRRVFGRFTLPYKREYQPVPFSARFVRHSAGWYGQRHPDDDFAETFAVWLTPGLDWRERYRGTIAMTKLLYVDGMARQFGSLRPTLPDGDLDMPVDQMTITVGSWFRKERRRHVILHPILDEDLRRLLPASRGEFAAEFVAGGRHRLARDVHDWTGIDLHLAIALVDALLTRIRMLELRIEEGRAAERMGSLSVFVTVLATNYLKTGQFVEV